MAKAKPWKEIRDQHVSPERQERNTTAAKGTIKALQRLRRARYLTQMQLTTAMGGTLELTARFPDGETEIIDLVPVDSKSAFEDVVA